MTYTPVSAQTVPAEERSQSDEARIVYDERGELRVVPVAPESAAEGVPNEALDEDRADAAEDVTADVQDEVIDPKGRSLRQLKQSSRGNSRSGMRGSGRSSVNDRQCGRAPPPGFARRESRP